MDCIKPALGAALTASLLFVQSANARTEKVTLGYLETAYVGDSMLEMGAKLDTGADFSSIYARDIKVFQNRDKEEWVSFRLVGDDGRTIRYKKKVIRTAFIKTKTGGNIERPVISLDLCVGGLTYTTPVNLADREDFDHPLLVGREFLARRVLVDSGQSYTADEGCVSAAEEQNPS
ncbi:MAG: hypothetical protein CMK07_12995 [Ponticaulis sp.]|nr:hypothetical protein [Ponticaulis sp.]